jgi:GTPase SAR1 family protein
LLISADNKNDQVSYPQNVEMDRYTLTILGDGDVGKTALLVQVC